MSHTFQVGDKIQFTYINHVFTALIVSVDQTNYTIQTLDEDHPFRHTEYQVLPKNSSLILEPTVPVDPKERVSKKMKLLWNNSNYVKHNPERAY